MVVNIPNSDMMATALAHEIKNPAALALAYVSLIRQTTDFYEISEFCDYIQQALLDISDLVQDLLFAAQHKPEMCLVHITELLSEMLGEYRAAMPGMSFLLHGNQGLSCYTYDQHLRLVFSNLLKNAAEATDREVAVCVKAEDRFIYVSIQNSKDFDTTKPHSSGMGLGICNWLLEQMGGKLEIENKSNFTALVCIPCNLLC